MIESEQMIRTDWFLETEVPKTAEELQDMIEKKFPHSSLRVVMSGYLDEDSGALMFIKWLGENQFYRQLRLFLINADERNKIINQKKLQEALKYLPRAEMGKVIVLERRDFLMTNALEKPGVVYETGKSITILGQVFPLTKVP